MTFQRKYKELLSREDFGHIQKRREYFEETFRAGTVEGLIKAKNELIVAMSPDPEDGRINRVLNKLVDRLEKLEKAEREETGKSV
jgi:hypothetical protein